MVKLKTKKITTECSRCRRSGDKLFLKGEKCMTAKCPFTKRSYAPGQHGPNQRRGKTSGYGKQLREKQKVKYMYGILEKQFSNYVVEASKKTGDTSKYLLTYLESRLDNVVFRAGLAKSRSAARQYVVHGLVAVDGKKVDRPSFRVKVGDVISISEKGKKRKTFVDLSEKLAKVEVPSWVALDIKANTAKILNTPTLEDASFNAKSIIEFYSR
ncbi:30S ribosomal protein S4 [Patescibacteria group bacterium]|nr:30S ribosomal protein S4 [Patescibacteria group bacterium]MBU1613114.1 30S ribosomal protein S4 [Patescibacteria group bacterium]